LFVVEIMDIFNSCVSGTTHGRLKILVDGGYTVSMFTCDLRKSERIVKASLIK